MATWPEVRDYLYSLRNSGARFGIERMERLARLLGQPQWQYPVIHVAGTNGKGSVCAMLAAIYQAAGRRVGLFTSPHLVHLGERVQVDGEQLGDAQIAEYVAELRPLAAKLAQEDPELHPTFFEFMTAMAFEHFRRERVDLAVVEVGLGGRLDSTNVVRPTVSVVTSIGLDHQHILGDTLEKIAFEKGGIIKPGAPVVLGVLPPTAEGVLRGLASERGCAVHSVRERFALGPPGRALSSADYDRLPASRLPGRYQRLNAATSVLTSEIAALVMPDPGALPDAALTKGLANVTWPGRWQEITLANGGRLILDATHNADGIREIEPTLADLRAEAGPGLKVMTGVLGVERAREIMPVLSRYAGHLYCAQPAQPRACPPETLAAMVPAGFTGRVTSVPDLGEPFRRAGKCAFVEPGETLLVIGSIYLIGEALEHLTATPAEASLQDRI